MLRVSVLLLTLACFAQAADLDGDGIDDDLEHALLQRFVPQFLVNPADCDAAPSEFRADTTEPTVVAKNGTIYGQVSPSKYKSGPSVFVEIHFYHLWSRDCGRMSHRLDAESVTALVSADHLTAPAKEWRAEYWYAAAHEDTLCDMSHGAKANSADRGPRVWVSKDKHASFLSRELCALGCGKDDCENAKPLVISQMVNLGEPGAPLNGAVWTASAAWPLQSKMQADFVDSLVARMPEDSSVHLLPARDSVKGMRTTIKVAESTFGALETANTHTGDALSTSIGTAFSSTGKALKNATRWLRRN